MSAQYTYFTKLIRPLAIAAAVLIYLFAVIHPIHAAAGIYKVVNFQGKVVAKTTGLNVANGNYDFTFKIYSAASGGSPIWTENFNSANGNQLTVTDGIFRAPLGSVCVFSGGSCQGNTNSAVDFNSDSLYLEIVFNSDTMGTRVQFTSVPYAMNAATVAGLTFSGTSGNTYTLPSTNNGTILTSNAPTQGIASAQTSGTLLALSDSTGLAAAITGASITLSGTGAFDQTGLSFSLTNASGTNLNDVLGTGSTWKVSNAGAATFAGLTLNGSASISGTLTLANGQTIKPAYGPLTLSYKSGGNTWATGITLQDTTGNVGIGTTAPGAKLQVIDSSAADTVGGIIGETYQINSSNYGSFGANSRVGLVGSAYYSGVPNLATNPLGSQYASAGIVGIGGGSSGNGYGIGVAGFGQTITNATGLTAGGKFLANSSGVLNAGDSFYGVYSQADSTANTVGSDNTYGIYATAIGQGTDTTYAGYFSGSGGGTNYGVYSAGGTNYFNGNVGIGNTLPVGLLDLSGTVTGKALAIFNTTGDQALFTASKSGATKFTIDNSGNASMSGSLTISNGQVIQSAYGPLYLDYKSGASTWSPGLILQDITGNVGIGSSLPNSRLDLGLSPSTPGNLQVSTYSYVGSEYSGASTLLGYNAKADTTATAQALVANTNTVGYDFILMNSGGIQFHTQSGSVNAGNVAANEAMRILQGGNVGIGDSSPASLFTVGNGDLFQVNSSGAIVASTGLTLSSGGITLGGSVSDSSHCLVGGATAAWGSCGGVGGTNWWNLVSGIGVSNGGYITPINSTADFLLGGQSTASADFAVLNLNTGTPLASISAGANNYATYLTGDGTLATTNKGNLTIGNSSTYNTTGDILINPNGTGNVAIGGAINTAIRLNVTGNIAITGSNGLYSSYIYNTGSGNNARIQMTTNGMVIDRNISDANPALIVQQINGTSTGDILQLKNNSSTLFTVGQSGNASMSGTLTIGNGQTIQPAYGPLSFAYKSGPSIWTTGITLQDTTGNVGIGVTNPLQKLHINGSLLFENNNGVYSKDNAGNQKFLFYVDGSNQVSFGYTGSASTYYNSGGPIYFQIGAGVYKSTLDTNGLSINNGSTGPGSGNGLLIGSGNLALAGTNPSITNTGSNTLTLNSGSTGNLQLFSSSNTLTSAGALTIASTLSSGSHTLTGTNPTISATSTNTLTLNSGVTGAIQFFSSSYSINSSGALTVASCSGCGGAGGTNYFAQNNGLTYIGNTTTDFALGGNSTGSADFVFGGLNSGTPTATFSGNLILNQKPNTAATDMQKWAKITGTAGTIGGGTAGVASISAAVVFNGSLYVGTNNVNNAEIYRYDGDALGTWTKVSGTAGTVGGNATTAIDMISSLIVYNGYLYAGTTEADKAEVYRYNGGSSWSELNVTNTAGKFLTNTLIDGVSSMAVFGGRLFIGTRESLKAEIYMYNGGTTWIAVNGTAGTFVATNTVAQDAVTQMVVWNNTLLAGTMKNGVADGDVIRWNGIVGGSNFFALNLASTTGSYLIDSAAQTGTYEVTAMTIWAGKLIIGIRRAGGQADILMYQEPPSGAAPINSWTRLNSAAGTITTTAIDTVTALTVAGGRLYAGTNKLNSAEVYRYDGEKSWTRVSQNTVGQLAAGGTTAIDDIAVLLPYNNGLFAGTMEGTTAEGYVYSVSIDQSYALEFRAGGSQGGGEQNNLQNLASIFFVASLSANLNNKQGNTGTFVFDHGITTNNGSYDVAEDYPTRDDTFEPGDLVSIDPNERGFVVKSQGQYDYTTIGVYSEKPALRLSQNEGTINGGIAIPVALAGRVPVKVSTENGAIKSGDFLTSSSVAGVAMKAKKSGVVIGQAMENYDADGVGKITVYVKSSSYNGSIAESFENININSNTLGKDLLSSIASSAGDFANSDIVTGRLVAGLEIVTPKLSANEVYIDKLTALSNDIAVNLASDGKLTINNPLGAAGVTFDAFGNATFAGLITADKIKANSIEGLEIWTNQILDLKSQISNLQDASNSAVLGTATSSASFNNLSNLDSLNNAGIATVSADLNVKGNSLIEGMLTVFKSITTPNIIISDFASFFGDVFFKKNVSFEGRPTFNNDTAGFAVINQGENQVEVIFDTEYPNQPVITASIALNKQTDPVAQTKLENDILGGGISYLITNQTSKGFIIKLSKPAPEDVSFSWISLAVKDAKTLSSASNKSSVANNPQATQSAAFQSILNQLNN